MTTAASRDRFIDLPRWMYDRAASGGAYGLAPARVPAPPARPQPERPRVRGEALVLADRALERNDAFDAAAQYRELLVDVSPDARRYIELQLARAYTLLDETDEAERLLRRLVSVDDELAWPAAYELALLWLVVGRADAASIFQQLDARVGAHHRDELARQLLHLAPEPQVAPLVDAIRGADPHSLHTCVYELLRFEKYPPLGVPAWDRCPVAGPPPRLLTTPGKLIWQEIHFERLIGHWTEGVQKGRIRDGSWWLTIAREAADVAAEIPDHPSAYLASWLGLAACHNANVASGSAGLVYDAATRTEIVERLHPPHRAKADELLGQLWRAGESTAAHPTP